MEIFNTCNRYQATFSIRCSNRLALAELSLMECPIDIHTRHTEYPIYFFNRLHVPTLLRNKGFGKRLMVDVCHWADDVKCIIFNPVNVYGDSPLSVSATLNFYRKFDFQDYPGQPNVLIRYPK